MKLKTRLRLVKARKDAEKELGFRVGNDLAKSVLDYCVRKLSCIKKDEDYLPLLYRCELPLQVQMRAINEYSLEMMKLRKEDEEYVRNLPSGAMSPSMP